MSRLTFATLAGIVLLSTLCSGKLSAQTVCDQGNGHLDPAQPAGIAPSEIIQKFSAKETIFKAARERYGYTLNVSVQTLDNFGRVDGEYRQISQIELNDEGKRIETTTFAPMNTLRRLALTEDDLDDFRQRLPFMLTPADLPHYLVTYAGQQHVDEINTFVFDVAPQNEKKEKKDFDGRIWVDDRDFMIVKSCGKPREDENAKSTKKNVFVNLAPLFVTYREQIDGQYWFPTYAKADEFLRFPRGLVHVREVVKYSGYKPLSAK